MYQAGGRKMSQHPCPTCGAEIETDRPGGLCPACLLNEGLSVETVRRDVRLQCTKCGSSLGDDARFCAQCGAPASPVAEEGDPIRGALEAQLRGQYRIIRLLGRGGMGAVYLARDLTLEREVAVKVIRTPSHAQEIYERFRREAKTAARLSHPNIVPLHTFGEVEGMPYFVMGYVRGESLAARLAREGRMSEEEGLRVLAEIADALDHAHRQGVVHRDVKPDNVLIEDESGRAMLTDFGVAKALGRGETMTLSGSVVGTPQYMSPEQASGRGDVDARSDIYSLGVMAYAILGGRLPFDGTTASEVLTRHLTQDPPPLRSFNADLSHATAQAVERCLAKDPSKRWPDARSLGLALGAGDDSRLPDALQSVEGRGIPGLAIVVAYVVGFWLFGEKYGFWDDGGVIFFLSQSVVFGFLYLFVIVRMRKQGFSPAQSQAAIWREPSWWLWWYPKAWRRRGNVWDRLPREIRIVRGILPGIWVTTSVMLLVWFVALADMVDSNRPLDILVLVIVTMAIAVWVIAGARGRRELERKGIEGEDLSRVLYSVPPSRVGFWSRPHIAEVLAPAEGADRAKRSDSPHAYLQSVLRFGNELPGPLRPLGGEAAVAARMLLASIEEVDREIAELARSLESGEQERLTAKIAALGGGADSAPLRTLLERELELIRGLAERVEEANETRNRRMEMLRSLSLHLADLRARSAESSDSSAVTDRVRALCDTIAAQAATERR
jgi:tRNA A-37 threonylcarbamoyl transferase component Bud32